jgi:hypothetical protein
MYARRYLEIQDESRVVQAAVQVRSECNSDKSICLNEDYLVYREGQHLLMRVTSIQVGSAEGAEPQVAA